MTLGDGKRKVLMLLDEYSTGGTVVPENDSAVADINFKMADFFDMAQKDMASHMPIVKSSTVTLTGEEEYINLPSQFKKYLRVWKNGEQIRKYPIIDNKIITDHDTGTILIEYIATPATIPMDAPDSYEFEVTEEAANCLPYYVASQQLITDLVVDYTALWNMYIYHKQLLDTSLISESGSNGRVVQALFGVKTR